MSLELIQQIRKAFENSAYPGDEDLIENDFTGIDQNEIDTLKSNLQGKTKWQSLDAKLLDVNNAVPYLTDRGFRFLLPAYMIADINGKLEWYEPSTRLCWSFTLQSGNQKIAEIYGGGTVGERDRECFKYFTDEQVSSIVSYLKWKLDQHPEDLCISQALENYWLPREANRTNESDNNN